jgi:hypothetical protein
VVHQYLDFSASYSVHSATIRISIYTPFRGLDCRVPDDMSEDESVTVLFWVNCYNPGPFLAIVKRAKLLPLW